jgi:hypothetical protein
MLLVRIQPLTLCGQPPLSKAEVEGIRKAPGIEINFFILRLFALVGVAIPSLVP